MAIHADTVVEVRPAGSGSSDNNGGAFKSSATGTDYSIVDSPHATLTAASLVNATTTIIDVDAGDYTCADTDVGNFLQITGGTATAGFYEITARSAQQWTLDRSAGTVGQTVVGNMGGALATPGMMSKFLTDHGVHGNSAHIKSGTYTLTTSSANVSGGVVSLPAQRLRIWGYETSRLDYGAKPVLDAGAQTSVTLWTNSGAFAISNRISNIKCDGNSGASNNGFDGHAWATLNKCEAVDCPGFGFDKGNHIDCLADGCGVGFDTSAEVYRNCVARNCTDDGFRCGSGASYDNCLSHDNGGSGFDPDSLVFFKNCTAVGNTLDGFDVAVSAINLVNCVATNNTQYGFRFNATYPGLLVNCADYLNTAGRFLNDDLAEKIGQVQLTADPWQAIGSDDYRPNTTVGGGAALRAAGIGPTGQTNAIDIGAVQHADPAGGGDWPTTWKLQPA